MTDDVEATQPAPAGTGSTVPPEGEPAAEPALTQPLPVPPVPEPTAETAQAADEPAAVPALTQAQPAPPVQPEPAAAPAPSSRGRRGGGPLGIARSLAIGTIFILACLSLILATTTWWLHDTVLDTDHFVALTAPLVESEQVQDALVEVTVNQVDGALDLGPIGRYVVTGIAREVYASDAFAQVWERAMGAVHKQLLAVLRNDSTIAQVDDGKVVINLFPVIDGVLQQINGLGLVIAGREIALPTLTNPEDPAASRAELSAALGRELQPTFGTVAVADSAKLEAAQRYVVLFDALVVVLFVVTALLALLAIALARHRVRMVALLGIGGLAALLAARLVINAAADGLATAVVEAGPGAIIGSNLVAEIAASYREFARVVLVVALAVGVIATAAELLLARRSRAASGADGRWATDGWFLALVGLCVALAALLLVGLTLATLALAVVAYVVWIVIVVRSTRRGPTPAPAAGAA